MRKHIAIVLVSIYLFSITEVHQLLKMPLLVEHYLAHKNANKELSLLSFLEMHYLNGSHMDADSTHDMQLPFKNLQDNHPNVVVTLPSDYFFFETIPNIKQQGSIIVSKSQVLESNYLKSIWQPPKIA